MTLVPSGIDAGGIRQDSGTPGAIRKRTPVREALDNTRDGHRISIGIRLHNAAALVEPRGRISAFQDKPSQDLAVAKRARIYRQVPLKEIIDRRWIEDSADIDILEGRLLKFYEIDTLSKLDQPLNFNHAPRQSTSYSAVPTPAQRAWLCRAKQLAQKLQVIGRFSDQSFDSAVMHLRNLKSEVEQLRQVPETLSRAGIRFLIVQPLANTKIDGVCFWLDDESPVIVLSLRYDRIDWFWHTFMHEMFHVKNRDGRGASDLRIDTALVGTDAEPFDDKPENEKLADQYAVEFLVNQQVLDQFIYRIRPYYSAVKIAQLAQQLNVHAGIVVGQLQHRREIPYSHSRRMLMGVKQTVTAATMTDGWGWVPHL